MRLEALIFPTTFDEASMLAIIVNQLVQGFLQGLVLLS
jgi:hypothetical protein